MGVSGSVCQGWVVELEPTELQNGPTNGGVVSTPLPIKLSFLASWIKTERKGVKSGRTSLACATKPIDVTTPLERQYVLSNQYLSAGRLFGQQDPARS